MARGLSLRLVLRARPDLADEALGRAASLVDVAAPEVAADEAREDGPGERLRRADRDDLDRALRGEARDPPYLGDERLGVVGAVAARALGEGGEAREALVGLVRGREVAGDPAVDEDLEDAAGDVEEPARSALVRRRDG